MNRTKDWRIHQLKRIIKKRTKIVKTWCSPGIFEHHPLEDEPHRMHKFNLNCGCKMCHFYKHVGNSSAKFTDKQLDSNNRFKKEKQDLCHTTKKSSS